MDKGVRMREREEKGKTVNVYIALEGVDVLTLFLWRQT